MMKMDPDSIPEHSMMKTDEHENAMIIRSPLLSQFSAIIHGISSRIGGVSSMPFGLNLSYNVGDEASHVSKNRERFFHALNIDVERLATPYQVHSSVVRIAKIPGRYEACDGVISATPGIFLAITIADCLPILLYDFTLNVVAAVHSGWRGTKDAIVKNAITAMQTEYGSRPENIVAFIGPGAGKCCYEVGEEVATLFPDEHVIREERRKTRLDLKEYVKNSLFEKGVLEHHVHVSLLCTICSPALLHSYRREGTRSGRMMAVIGISQS